MSSKKFLWHLDLPEEENYLEAHYIFSLIQLANRRLNKRYRRLLDIPCGVGRHHKYLREYGLEVYGVDAEEELIKSCKKNHPDYAEYYNVLDMRDISYNEEFDIVLNWYTSFGYFSDEENKTVLRNFNRALTDKGILIIDYPTHWSPIFRAAIHSDKYLELSSLEEIEKYKFRYRARLYDTDPEYSKLLKVDEIEAVITIYPPENLKEMLEDAGFEILYAFRGRSFSSLPLESLELYNLLRSRIGRIVWVAYKK